MTESSPLPSPPPVAPYLTVSDGPAALAFYERAFGAKLAHRQDTPDGKKPLGDQFWGDRYGQLVDPSGHQWSLVTRQRQVTKAELNSAAEEHFGSK